MELLDLQIFEQVARERSISRAAAGLTMAQPSVSQRLQGLEAEVGRPLFRRHRRGVELTEAGKSFLPYVERMLGLLAEGVEAVRTSGEVTRISLAAPPSISAYFMPPLVRRLVDAGHDVLVQTAHSHEVMQQLLDGVIHAGFILESPGRSGIAQRPVCHDPILCVTAHTHPLAMAAREEELTLADLVKHRIAIYSFARPGYLELQARLEAALGAPLRGLLKTSPVELARSMALSGEYVTFVPRMTVAADLEAGRLVALPLSPGEMAPYAWNICVAYRDRKVLEPAVAALLQALDQLMPGTGRRGRPAR